MRKALVAAVTAVLVAPTLASAQDWRTVTMSRQIEDNDEVRVIVDYGAGRFNVTSTDDGVLYRMTLRYDEDRFEPIADFSGDRLELGVESLGRRWNIGKGDNTGQLDLELARGIPMDLELNFGAVRADLDLGGLALTDLALRTGASESTVDMSEPNIAAMRRASFEAGAAEFTACNLGNLNAERIEVAVGVGDLTLGFSGRWEQDAAVSIDMGLGALELRFPEGLGVRLRKNSFLTSLDSEGMVKRGDAYYSLDWDDADKKITIDLDAAFGSVKVVWVH
ncbi:MAG: toast rack family protein [Longimicrobiales bacterium]